MLRPGISCTPAPFRTTDFQIVGSRAPLVGVCEREGSWHGCILILETARAQGELPVPAASVSGFFRLLSFLGTLTHQKYLFPPFYVALRQDYTPEPYITLPG